MKKSSRMTILFLLITMFIGSNFYLLYSKEGEQLAKISFVTEWNAVFQQDLYKTIKTTGVLHTEEETYTYFDDTAGSFLEFLVEQGDMVKQNDPLYTYQVDNYKAVESRLQQTADQLSGEIIAIEEALIKIKTYEVPETPSVTPPENNVSTSSDPLGSLGNDQSSQNSEIGNNIQTEYLKQQYIIDKERELAQKRAALKSVEVQLSALTAEGDIVTITSTAEGIVTDISPSLENPVATVAANNLIIKGTLTEKERKLVKEDMEVSITMESTPNKATGYISKLSTFPQETNLYQTSTYPFQVGFRKSPEALLPGYHADLSIITEQALSVPVVFTDQLLNSTSSYLPVMNKEGKIELRELQTGITTDKFVEVKGGAELGEWVVKAAQTRIRENTAYVTPIMEELIPWQNALTLEHGTWKPTAFLQGFVLH